MREKLFRTGYVLSSILFGVLAALFIVILVMAISGNPAYMIIKNGLYTLKPGNYLGLTIGFAAYGIFMLFLMIPRIRHNLNWTMKFTHELTHTLISMLFLGKIKEFVVKDRECYVNYQSGPFGYVPITLSPYCIPIYTVMIFPFRFTGEGSYMIYFDVLIAFTYAFHIHSFIRQTRFTQRDIQNCGKLRSVLFITWIHLTTLSIIMAIPRGGVLNAFHRIFWKYPVAILTDPQWVLEYIMHPTRYPLF